MDGKEGEGKSYRPAHPVLSIRLSLYIYIYIPGSHAVSPASLVGQVDAAEHGVGGEKKKKKRTIHTPFVWFVLICL